MNSAPSRSRWIGAGAILLLFSVTTSLQFLNCAHMETPPGGPADSTRPYLTAVYPAPGATGVPRELKAKFAFSEWISPEGAATGFTLSPPLPRRVKAEIKGNLLELSSPGALDSHTTYTISLLPSLVDINRNALTEGYTLVFSTGPTLDSGKVEGRINEFEKTVSGGIFQVVLYPTSDWRGELSYLKEKKSGLVKPDSQPIPFRERPMYLAQTDSTGLFTMEGIREGDYSILAFRDQNMNFLPDPGSENLAVGHRSLRIGAATAFQNLATFPYDSIPARIASVDFAGENTGDSLKGIIRLQFNQPIHPHSLQSISDISIEGIANTDSGKAIRILGVSRNPKTGSPEIYAEPLRVGRDYTIRVKGARDLGGKLLDTLGSRISFRTDGEPDSLPSEYFFLGPADALGKKTMWGDRNLARGTLIPVYSVRPITDSLFQSLLANLDVRADSFALAFDLQRESFSGFTLKPGPIPQEAKFLSVGLRRKRVIQDSLGSRDTIYISPLHRFTLLDPATLGSVGFQQHGSTRNWILVFRRLSDQVEFLRNAPNRVSGQDRVTIDSLPAGNYRVDYFEDTDGDRTWSPGGLFPWWPQEKHVRWIDSLEIKGGDTSDIQLEMTWPQNRFMSK